MMVILYNSIIQHGEGTYYNKDGTYYKGEFMNHKRNGKGKYYTFVAVFDEEWLNDVKIDSKLYLKID